MPYKDPEAKRANDAKYRAENRGQIRERDRKYYHSPGVREAKLKYSAKYDAEHREEKTKSHREWRAKQRFLVELAKAYKGQKPSTGR